MNNRFPLLRLPWVMSALLGTGLLLLSGCGGGSTATVSGTVTYKDKPLPGGLITFMAEQGDAVARGKIEKDGTYRVNKVPVGNVKIGIQASEPPKYGAGMIPKEEAAKLGKKATAVDPGDHVTLPKQFADPNKSGLTYTVKHGPQEHNISLK
jgi:hypothetical protein